MEFKNYLLSDQEIKEAIRIHVVVYSWCMRDIQSLNADDKKLWEDTYRLIKSGGIYDKMYKFSLGRAKENDDKRGVSLERLEKNLLLLERGFFDS